MGMGNSSIGKLSMVTVMSSEVRNTLCTQTMLAVTRAVCLD